MDLHQTCSLQGRQTSALNSLYEIVSIDNFLTKGSFASKQKISAVLVKFKHVPLIDNDLMDKRDQVPHGVFILVLSVLKSFKKEIVVGLTFRCLLAEGSLLLHSHAFFLHQGDLLQEFLHEDAENLVRFLKKGQAVVLADLENPSVVLSHLKGQSILGLFSMKFQCIYNILFLKRRKNLMRISPIKHINMNRMVTKDIEPFEASTRFEIFNLAS
jgi:hypothetical protein